MGALTTAIRAMAYERQGLTWSDIFTTGPASLSGVSVTEQTAIQSSTVFRCVSIVAGLIASLPFGVYRSAGDGSESASDHPLHPVLHDAPSEQLTSYTFRHLGTSSLLLWGNSYARIANKTRRDGLGAVELLYLPPDKVQVERKAGRLEYTYTDDQGAPVPLPPERVLHVPGLGFDGIKGESVIGTAGKEPIGLQVALERLVAAMHANGARPSGVYTHNGKLTPEALKNLRTGFRDLYEGRDNTGRTIFLELGAAWSPMSIKPIDLETMAARRYQVSDIARLFGVPLHFLGETEKSTSWGSGLEELTAGFVRYTIRPWLVAIEQEYTRKLRRLGLLGPEEWVEFNLEGLLRGDSRARAELYASGVQNGWMTPNEVRRKENLPPDPAGAVLYGNGSLRPLGATDADTTAQE